MWENINAVRLKCEIAKQGLVLRYERFADWLNSVSIQTMGGAALTSFSNDLPLSALGNPYRAGRQHLRLICALPKCLVKKVPTYQ
jgi:hypothetical protein